MYTVKIDLLVIVFTNLAIASKLVPFFIFNSPNPFKCWEFLDKIVPFGNEV